MGLVGCFLFMLWYCPKKSVSHSSLILLFVVLSHAMAYGPGWTIDGSYGWANLMGSAAIGNVSHGKSIRLAE